VNELAAPLPFELPAEREIRLASPTTVKRTKMSYGDGGILMLTSDRLLFVTQEAKKCWSLPLSEITDVARPSYGLGTYVTFEGRGEYYALAFAEDAVDAARLSSISDAFGPSSAGTTLKALSVAGVFSAASSGGEWYGILSGEDAREREDEAAAMEALWQAQQQESGPDQPKTQLAQAVLGYVEKGWHIESQTDLAAVLVKKRHPPNHLLHLLLTIFTLGLWGIVWLIATLTAGEKRVALTIDEHGRIKKQRPVDSGARETETGG
jgi:hypothetical protein